MGLTATPMRLDPSQQLSEVFQKLIRGPSITELVSSGVIVPPVAHLINLVRCYPIFLYCFTTKSLRIVSGLLSGGCEAKVEGKPASEGPSQCHSS